VNEFSVGLWNLNPAHKRHIGFADISMDENPRDHIGINEFGGYQGFGMVIASFKCLPFVSNVDKDTATLIICISTKYQQLSFFCQLITIYNVLELGRQPDHSVTSIKYLFVGECNYISMCVVGVGYC